VASVLRCSHLNKALGFLCKYRENIKGMTAFGLALKSKF